MADRYRRFRGIVQRLEPPAPPPPPPPVPPLIVGADFNGPVYDHDVDHARLTGQILRVFTLMQDGEWRTLAEIEATTGDPPASISAQLRHLRKRKFGSYQVDKRPRGEREQGLWEYKLGPPDPDQQPELELAAE